VPETRRLVLAKAGPAAQRPFRLAWSRWRRAHQAVAARCHAARRALRTPGKESMQIALHLLPGHRALTDAEWERVRLLLPPQKPMTGRPRHDHRTMLNGILAVVGTELSWRDIPKEYGKRDRAYKRYRLWQDQGLLPRIIATLADSTAEMSL
jgi:transposase